MSKTSNEKILVTLAEIGTQSGWSLEAALQHLRIVPEPDWCGRPSVSTEDALRLFRHSTSERDEWQNQNDQRQAAQLAAEHYARFGTRPGQSPPPFFRKSSKASGPAGGHSRTDFPG